MYIQIYRLTNDGWKVPTDCLILILHVEQIYGKYLTIFNPNSNRIIIYFPRIYPFLIIVIVRAVLMIPIELSFLNLSLYQF